LPVNNALQLRLEQLQSTERGRESREELAYPSLLRAEILKTSGLLKDGFLCPIQGKPIEKGRVPLIAPDFEEILLESLV